MSSNLLNDAKNILLNSSVIKYINKEELDNAFSRIFVYDNYDEFLEAYGRIEEYKDGRLEGFNRKNSNYLGPYATPHTVIHEVLHSLSSKFDKEGHRLQNGIMGDKNLNFANQINEGATDYLACKLSGESPRNYIQGHKLFSRLEPMLVKSTENEDILLQTYINNDVNFLSDFFNKYGTKDTFENLYNNFLYLDDDKMNIMMDMVEKNLDKDIKRKERTEKINNLIGKIKNIFFGKNTKMLPEGNSNKDHFLQDNLTQCKIENWSPEDKARYEEYQRNPVKEVENINQSQNINNEKER